MMKTVLMIVCLCVLSASANPTDEKDEQLPPVERRFILTAIGNALQGKELVTTPLSMYCATACTANQYQHGRVIGTPPFCAGKCTDCPSDAKCLDLYAAVGGCLTGSKVCCCTGKISG